MRDTYTGLDMVVDWGLSVLAQALIWKNKPTDQLITTGVCVSVTRQSTTVCITSNKASPSISNDGSLNRVKLYGACINKVT